MCEICRQSPCHPSCPNAPDPQVIDTCHSCKEDIVVGDMYYEFDGNCYHEDCFSECAVDLLLKSGAELKEAEEIELDDGSDALYEQYRDEMLYG